MTNVKTVLLITLIGRILSQEVLAQQRYVSITFDDLPATMATAEEMDYITDNLLAIFTEYEIPIIGFVNEEKLYENEVLLEGRVDMLRRWLESGADLGNHTYSHIYINNASIEQYKEDVLKGEQVIKPLMKEFGKKLAYFRHTQLRTGPTEAYKEELTSFLKGIDYTIAPVTIDNDEYIYAFCYARASRIGDQEVMEYIKEDYISYMERIFEFYEKQSVEFLGREPKQTLLLHANKLNADAFEGIVKILQKRGYTFIPMSEALEDAAYQLPEIQSEWGLSWLHRWMWAAGEEPENHPGVSSRIDALYNRYRGN